MKHGAYETYDLVLASFLIAAEASHLIDIATHDGGRKLFCFDPAPSKEDLIKFYSGEATVSARRFAEVFASLKGAGYTMREFS